MLICLHPFRQGLLQLSSPHKGIEFLGREALRAGNNHAVSEALKLML